ncbi:MAG: dCTP deaminase domain-containing protein [Stellaceae bacterium]
MTVIALTASGPDPSVVISNDAFSREGKAILIQNGDDQQLGPDASDCNATYDLRVGQRFRDHRSQDGQDLDRSGEIRLLPGNAVIIEMEEVVKFPKWRFGQILPKVSLLQKGVANTPSKVDPGYEGHLLVTAFNHGRRTVSLHRFEPFCSLHVFDVGGPIRAYDKPGKQISGARRSAAWLQKIDDWIDANVPKFVELVAIVVTAAVAIIALFLRR